MLLKLVSFFITTQLVLSTDNCPENFGEAPGISNNKCYHFNSNQLMDVSEAVAYCNSVRDSELVTPTSMAELDAIDAFSGMDGGQNVVGYWLGYWRREWAPFTDRNYMEIRRNKDLYKDSNSNIMPEELWREGQPGDKTDNRDERCVVRKAPNNPNFRGVDDFVCYGREHTNTPFALHYPMCQLTIPQ